MKKAHRVKIGRAILVFALLVLSPIYGCHLTESPDCVAGQVACTRAQEGNGDVLKICGSEPGDWQRIISCAKCDYENNVCLSGIPSCSGIADICIYGADNDISLTCNDGQMIPTVCNGKCQDGKCLSPYVGACPQNDQICLSSEEGSVHISCAGDYWTFEFCKDGCDAEGKSCMMNCLSGTTSNGYRCCQDIPHGSIIKGANETICRFECTETGYRINKEQTGCEPENCTENSTLCSNDSSNIGMIKKCTGNALVDGHKCSHVSCNSDGTDCGECVNDTVICENDGMTGYQKTCIGGSWQVTECPNGNSCHEDNTDCGECTNGTVKCEDVDTTGHIKKCTNGKWGESVKCPNDYSCKSDGKTCGDCVNMIKCSPSINHSPSAEQGRLSGCVNGVKIDEDCKNEASCNLDGLSCGECKFQASYCDNTELIICHPNGEKMVWNKVTDCAKSNRECVIKDGSAICQ